MYDETILIVEDDPQIRSFINYTLKLEGFKIMEACTGAEALRIAVYEKIDVLLLDLGLPDMDGMDVLSGIRKWSEMPIIIVSARDQDKEKAAALDAGADDYLTKPFSATELLARIRVALRHYYKMNKDENLAIYNNRELKLDVKKRILYKSGNELHLTKLEYELLLLFMKNIGKVLTYNYILNQIYGKYYGSDTQALRALMAGLRRKLEDNPAKPKYIVTEIGIGYRMIE